MKHNPFKPDPKLPWCRKCRAHTPTNEWGEVYFAGRPVKAHKTIRCKQCNSYMFSYTVLRKNNVLWTLVAVVTLSFGGLLYFLADSRGGRSPGDEAAKDVGACIGLLGGLPSAGLVAWHTYVLTRQNRWMKRQENKSEKQIEEMGKIYWRSVSPYDGDKPDAL